MRPLPRSHEGQSSAAQAFAYQAADELANDDGVVGLAVGGSWLTQQMDAYSDLDLVLVTADLVSDSRDRMMAYARRFGALLSAFTGEHVGEPRLLICLYQSPLLHVDIKFLTTETFAQRVETPELLLDKQGVLARVLEQSEAQYPYPDYQWIEDRFWIWMHYALLKIGRGEYLEALDFMAYLRITVLGPLLHIKNQNLPRGVRRVETDLNAADLEDLKRTIPSYDKASLLASLHAMVGLYRHVRRLLSPANLTLQQETEQAVMAYFEALKREIAIGS